MFGGTVLAKTERGTITDVFQTVWFTLGQQTTTILLTSLWAASPPPAPPLEASKEARQGLHSLKTNQKDQRLQTLLSLIREAHPLVSLSTW